MKLNSLLLLLLVSCTKTVVGPAGSAGTNGINGDRGADGSNGTDGTDGRDGMSMVSTVLAADALQCPNGGSVIVLAQDPVGDGVWRITNPGQSSAILCNGIDGLTPLSPMGTIEACSSTSSPWKEVLLCLNNGQVLGSFSESASGLNTRLAFLPAGNYTNTDSSGCSFTISVDVDNSSVVTWSSGSNGYGSWSADSYRCESN